MASRQLRYMRSTDLGYEPANLVHIQLRGQLQKEYGLLKEELSALPGVRTTTASMQPPYRIGSNAGGISWDGKDPEQDILVSFTAVHFDFAKTMEISLLEGRDFSPDFPGDVLQDTVAGFIVNRTLADMMGTGEHVGERINFLGINGTIVGVMEDYHFQPVGENIEPMALAPAFMDQLSHMVVRLEPGDPSGAITQIEEKWNELFPQFPFEYEFVQEVIDGMYRSEKRMASLLTIFTIVAMILASTGLFALASFTAERRTREIGIRKTLGAHAGQITWMMLRDFSLYIILSLVIALPAVWWLARWWLNDFSNRITLSADLFLMTSILTGIVAVLTVKIYQWCIII